MAARPWKARDVHGGRVAEDGSTVDEVVATVDEVAAEDSSTGE